MLLEKNYKLKIEKQSQPETALNVIFIITMFCGFFINVLHFPSAIKYTIIAAILGGLASVFVIAIIQLFDKTIKNEEYVNTKKLAFIDNKDNTEIFSILKIKLDSNKSILLTYFIS